jgi:hypothetical protein
LLYHGGYTRMAAVRRPERGRRLRPPLGLPG